MDLNIGQMFSFNAHYQHPCARDLAMQVPYVTFDDTNAHVLDMFSRNRELVSIPVVDGDRPIGLISRHIFMSQMSRPYHRELYEKKTCIAFMDKEPLIVDASTPIDTVGKLAVDSGDKTLADGFLITEQDKLLGFGLGLDLMRMLVHLQEEKNRQVMQSIEYASVIQRAMLNTSRQVMNETFDDACLLWQPRDVVGGDFYYFRKYPDGWFAVIADCTGHGVPGAFLTLIASSSIRQALQQHGPTQPALLMQDVHVQMKQMLGQNQKRMPVSHADDGMDAVFMWMQHDTGVLSLANARMPVMMLEPGAEKPVAIHAERKGIGYISTEEDHKWSLQHYTLVPDTILLTVSDGLIDQIGGPKRIAFGKKRLRELFVQHQQLPMPAMAEAIMHAHHLYQGNEHRRDDIALFGFRLPNTPRPEQEQHAH